MASTGMLHRGRNPAPEGGDDVQKSLELLDSVLSEFEDGEHKGSAEDKGVESGGGGGVSAVGQVQGANVSTAITTGVITPDDDSPSLGGHQSEDDGYMSMNGRRTKFALAFRPTEEKNEAVASNDSKDSVSPLNISEASVTSIGVDGNDENFSPPPPSEAERIICNLLPKVSPLNTSKKSIDESSPPHSLLPELILFSGDNRGTSSSTQTTFPKTRHQRPYGWEKGSPLREKAAIKDQTKPPCKFSSLPFGTHQPSPFTSPPSWLPSRDKQDDSVGNKNSFPKTPKKSPSLDLPTPIYPLSSNFSLENSFVFSNKPYNEQPVTIYPGANVPYTKQLSSPTYGLPKIPIMSSSFTAKISPVTPDAKKSIKRENISDGEMLSPKNKVPPRTLAGSMERHREVCRGPIDSAKNSLKGKKTTQDEEEHFSDDSLENSLPPPPSSANVTPSKRASIAWEVSLDGDDQLLTPGSTKVVGRRRRKSEDNSNSSTGSIPQKVDEWIAEANGDYWPPPPLQCSTEDEIVSPFSDTESEQLPLPEDITEINATGTYIIRRGKKDRKNIPEFNKKPIKPPRNIQQHIQKELASKSSFDGDVSGDASSPSMSASDSHNSMSSLNSRLSSDLSIPHSRYSSNFNSRFSRELMTPNSRYSVDLIIPPSNGMGKELTSPKSRLSLDLNNSSDRRIPRDLYIDSPKKRSYDRKHDNFINNRNVSVPNKLSPQNRFVDFKKYSNTFDNIQSLMKDGVNNSNIDDFNDTSMELGTIPTSVIRVVSLPTLSEPETAARQILTTTMEEEEDLESPSRSSEDTSPLKKIENNITALLSQGRDHQFSAQYLPKDWDIHKDEYSDNTDELPILSNITYNSSERHKRNDIQKSSSHNEIPSKRLLDFHRSDKVGSGKRNGIHKSMSSKDVPISYARQHSSSDSTGSSGGDFPINVHIVDRPFKPSHLHDFGPLPNSPGSPQFPPLPPSPVQEVDEYSEIIQPLEKTHISKKKADTLPTSGSDMYHRSLDPPVIPPHKEPTTNSLKTRSMDTGFSRSRRYNCSNKSMSADRRTLPSDMGMSSMSSGRRRTLQRQRGHDEVIVGSGGLQTSASLPETPIFGRGCDVPRTPHRRTADTGPRQSSTMNSIPTISGSCTVGGYGRGTGSMERAIAGAELLRLAGGPARGWYPRQRHRPASIEHLERLPMSSTSNHGGQWDSSRKPLTLPPNLTPKFFQKSPREALRRVTSLLIRKGNSSKESSKKDKQAVSPAARSANGEEKPRKGFFKSFWKRSRHYSLEQP